MPYAFCEQIGKEIRDISDEIPFEIPDSWEWCRFGTIMVNRDSERIPLSVAEREKLDKIYDYYGASGVIDKVDKYLFNKPLLLIGEDGANLLLRSKPIAFIAKGEYWVNNHAHVLDTIGGLYMEYICAYINAINLSPYVTGTAQPKMNQEKMNSIFVPVPPVEEQHRIVSKIEELLPYIEKYGKAEEHLTSLNTTFPEALKKSILQEAVQGKLVPQNPDDEPASVLLERIRAEKQELIKSGKIKRDKHESIIVTRDKIPYEIIDGKERCIADEVPFELPDSWEWERLGNLFTIIRGSSPRPKGSPLYWTEHSEHNWITIKDISLYTENGVLYKTKEFLTDLGATKSTYVSKGEVVIAVSGSTTGKFCLLGIDGYIYDGLAAILNVTKIISTEYLVVFLDWIYQKLNAQKIGSAFPNINTDVLKSTFIPIPPIEEQHRIVAKIEEIMPYINTITK